MNTKYITNGLTSFLDDMRLGGIIYVKAEPEICAARVKIRAREGETIAIEYLQKMSSVS